MLRFEFLAIRGPPLDTLYHIVMFVLGLAFGSFANVVIWRFPRGESVSHPPSACPNCHTPIRWSDNIPVASWLLLRARCRDCSQPISARYPAVELISGSLWLLAGVRWGMTVQAAFAVAMFYTLLLLAFIDLDTMRLPNPLVGLLAGIGTLGAAITQVAVADAVPLTLPAGVVANSALATSAIGAVASAGVALAIAATYSMVRKQDGFGMGDVKLLGAIGIFLGLYGVLVLFLGAILGSLYGVVAGIRSGEGFSGKFPFGPFLALASVIVALYGPAAWSWYTGLLG